MQTNTNKHSMLYRVLTVYIVENMMVSAYCGNFYLELFDIAYWHSIVIEYDEIRRMLPIHFLA